MLRSGADRDGLRIARLRLRARRRGQGRRAERQRDRGAPQVAP
jgi:hypothetical protein